MKVGLLFRNLRMGGIQQVMLRLGEAFARRGVAVTLLVTRAEGELAPAVPADVDVFELPGSSFTQFRPSLIRADPALWPYALHPRLGRLRGLGGLARLPALSVLLAATRLNGLIAATPGLNVLAVLARRHARATGLRVVVSEHSTPDAARGSAVPWNNPRLCTLLGRYYLEADEIVAVSEGVRDALSRVGALGAERIRRIYNPIVSDALVTAAAAPPDHPWTAPGGPPLILGVGRIHPVKDFATLVRAFARLRQHRPARLVILGASMPGAEGKQLVAELDDLVRRLGILDDVALVGFVANPYSFMARAALLALSSRHEGLGNVLVEAMACGCPVVSTDCPSGPREILENGRLGALVPVGDDAALAAAMGHTLDAPPRRDALIARAAQFSVDAAAAAYLDLLTAGRAH